MSVRTFSVGDEVVLLDKLDPDFCMKVGSKYKVVGHADDGWHVQVAVGNKVHQFMPSRFELATAKHSEMLLSTDPTERKGTPITTGVLDYFPLAIAEVAKCSKAGNDQHNPGQPLHWAKDKSADHADCIARHLIDRGSVDTDGILHSAKLAWRALALLQIELEKANAS